MARDTEQALQLARLEADKLLGSIFNAGFGSFSLIRAELASGTPEGAKRLLRMRQSRGNIHYLDDLFMARAELLSGNRKAAEASFARVLAATEHYDAFPRLDIELQLACELTPGSLIQLTRSADSRRFPASKSEPPKDSAHPAPRPSPPVSTDHQADAAIDNIIGVSASVKAVKKSVVQFASLDAPVLITGDTGTGKDLVARALHETGSRRKHPFTAVNCASMTESLLESELFGHERGAFTGAERANKGLFEASGKGTIFLDEIGDISPRLQTALLRVLESGEIRAVGSARTRKINCRIIAATNATLDEKANSGKFRQDLLFRLRRLVIHIPPLCERKDDILPLVRHFLDLGRPAGTYATLSQDFIQAACMYDWPGNVRELRNVMERTRLLHSDKLSYTREDLDIKLRPERRHIRPAASGPKERTPAISPAAHANRSKGTAPPSPSAPQETDHSFVRPVYAGPVNATSILRNGRSPLRQNDRLKRLFQEHRKLTRSEVATLLQISPNTATKYLKTLCKEGFIKRIEPSASTRSHYFELRVNAPDRNA
jgi:DNA-binding NtrC family response regulator